MEARKTNSRGRGKEQGLHLKNRTKHKSWRKFSPTKPRRDDHIFMNIKVYVSKTFSKGTLQYIKESMSRLDCLWMLISHKSAITYLIKDDSYSIIMESLTATKKKKNLF